VGKADEIRDTAIAQPLLVAAALAAASMLGIGPAFWDEHDGGGASNADGARLPGHGDGHRHHEPGHDRATPSCEPVDGLDGGSDRRPDLRVVSG